MAKPVFLLAFAYDPQDALPGVVSELKSLESYLTEWGGSEVTVITRWQITQEQLSTDILNNKDELVLFHYSGHADSTGFELNTDSQKAVKSFVVGLAGLLGMCPNIKLAFLNGCSTEKQAQSFLEHKIPTVIATTQPLLDSYGLDFAQRFYKNFLRARGKLSLKQAFEAAFYMFLAENGNLSVEMLQEPMRGSFDEQVDMQHEPIYELHPKDGMPVAFTEQIDAWLDLKEKDTPPIPAPKTSESRKVIEDLISKGKVEEALHVLANHNDDATLLLARYNSVKNQHMMGLLQFSDYSQELNRISYSTLELSKQLK